MAIIIAFILSAIIVNAVQSLFMKLIGANVMFFDGAKKLFIIIVLAIVLMGLGL